MAIPAPIPATSVGEWLRIFAVLFARRRPDVSAEQAVAIAIIEFKASHALAPEDAVARCCN